MQSEGDRFGFYVEPGIMIRADKIKIQKIVPDPNYDVHAWMPIGSQLINGL
jgi:hypothetical protein